MTTKTDPVLGYLFSLEIATAYKGVTAWQISAEARLNAKLIEAFGDLADDLTNLILTQQIVGDAVGQARLRALMDEYQQEVADLINEHDQKAADHGREQVQKAPNVESSLTEFSESIRNRIRDTAFEASERTMDRITGNVKQSLADSYEKGLGIKEAATELGKVMTDMKRYELRRIARTEINSSQNLGAYETLQELGIPYGKWVSESNSPRTRNSHRRINGEIVPTGSAFSNRLRYPGDRSGPIREWINCFPADTLVDAAEVERAFKRFYEGEMITITTAEGNKLTGTPNHQILTQRGWIALNLLVEGDYAISSIFANRTSSRPDINYKPSTIDQVYTSLAQLKSIQRIAGQRMNFHGDGRESDVEIVTYDSLLRNRIESTLDQHGIKFAFPNADVLPSLLACDRALLEFAVGALHTANSSVSSHSQSSSLVGRALSHPDKHRFGTTARFDSTFEQSVPNSIATAFERNSDGILGFTGQVTSDQIVNIEHKSWHGYVYNLQTVSGWYIANGIITHNCRCRLVPFLMPEGMMAPGHSPFRESDLSSVSEPDDPDVSEAEAVTKPKRVRKPPKPKPVVEDFTYPKDGFKSHEDVRAWMKAKYPDTEWGIYPSDKANGILGFDMEGANIVGQEFDRLLTKYPFMKSRLNSVATMNINEIGPGSVMERAYAYMRPSSYADFYDIRFSPKWVSDTKRMNQQNDAAIGWSPDTGTPRLQSNISHEFGHAIDFAYQWQRKLKGENKLNAQGKPIKSTMLVAHNKIKTLMDDKITAGYVSQYATTNSNEAWAETFSMVDAGVKIPIIKGRVLAEGIERLLRDFPLV